MKAKCMGPHLIDRLMGFFKNTYYRWAQVFGEDSKEKIPFDYMYMYLSMRVQNPHSYIVLILLVRLREPFKLARWEIAKSFMSFFSFLFVSSPAIPKCWLV